MKTIFRYKKLTSLLKKTTQKLFIMYMLFIIFCICSCKKFIQVPSPSSQLATASVFNNNTTATSAITDIYSQIFSNRESYNIAIYNGMLSDELTDHNRPVFPNYLNNINQSSTGEWPHAYFYIYQANADIEGLQQTTGASPAVKNQLLGEAYFIRAFWHFYLTETYGAVPLVLTTDYTITSRLARTPRVAVMQQVITDLQMSESLLSNNYVDASDTVSTTDRVRPTKAVAAALLARAYLYQGDFSNNNVIDYQAAVTAATTVINNGTYKLSPLNGTNEVFTKNSSEAIWQLYTPQPNSINTYDGNQFILLSAPTSSSNNSRATISPQLLSAFETGDQRFVNWVRSVTANGVTYYFPYKYKIQTGGTPLTEYTMVLRLAEQYLIRAEAKAELGDVSAVTDINVIRSRAGLTNYSGGTDKASLLAAIFHERQVEFFTEWGHRWYDLERAANTTNPVNINTVMGTPGQNVCGYKGGIWNPDGHQVLYPIPLPDIKLDNNLTQNPGY